MKTIYNSKIGVGNSAIVFLIDTLVVIINLAAGRGNILLYWLSGLDKSGPINAIVILLDFLYVALRFRGHKSKPFKIPTSAILIIVIITVNLFNIIIEGNSNPLGQTIHLTTCFFFTFILYELANEYISIHINDDSAVKLYSRGFVWLALLSVLGVFISFIMSSIWGPQMVPAHADFLQANEDVGETYYRTYFSLNMYTIFGRIPFFQDYGMLCGLFHEPHTLAMGVFPGLILILGFCKKKIRWLVVASAVLMMLFAASATNILVVTVCVVLFLIINSKKRFIGSLIAAGAIFLVVMIYVSIDDTLWEFVIGRLARDNGSNHYSASLLQWTFSPKTLLGSNFLATEYVDEILQSSVSTKDVGFIPFFLNVLFILVFIRDSLKLILRRDRVGMAVGFASLYFILHCGKIGMTVFAQTVPIMVVFIQSFTLYIYGRIKNIK